MSPNRNCGDSGCSAGRPDEVVGSHRADRRGLLWCCLVLLFTCLLAIPLARQRFLYAALFARLQVEGVTLHFLDDVLLLNLALKPAQRVFKRLAFLYANLCPETTPPNRPNKGLYRVQEIPSPRPQIPRHCCTNPRQRGGTALPDFPRLRNKK